jgi:hypothetical protein
MLRSTPRIEVNQRSREARLRLERGRLAMAPFAHGTTSLKLRPQRNLQSCHFRLSTSAAWQPDTALDGPATTRQHAAGVSLRNSAQFRTMLKMYRICLRSGEET